LKNDFPKTVSYNRMGYTNHGIFLISIYLLIKKTKIKR